MIDVLFRRPLKAHPLDETGNETETKRDEPTIVCVYERVFCSSFGQHLAQLACTFRLFCSAFGLILTIFQLDLRTTCCTCLHRSPMSALWPPARRRFWIVLQERA